MRSLILPAVAVSLVLSGCNAGASARGGAEQVGAGLGDAVTAPLEDLNLRRDEIPTILLQAEANPYDLRNMNNCRTIGAEIARLDEALGPDTDAPPSQDGSYMSERAADAAAGATLDAVRGTVTDFIPARSWVRRLTGAEAHSKHVQSAIQAGLRRRSFLKGVGMQRNCAPPAAPAGFVPRRG
ncbi:hypothetical protein NI456_06590 [Brevundimonas diminuta]|uniref:hypothetical protein n=1 Tax=Brevundimonas TaxID=41275 RepID=UPI0002A447A6|nr:MULTISPECIES: hypothetical protein [Brevundimonas]EKY26785.1 hypothetical protein HMPREF0185_02417 [Brevundimonas diminuta 470-4]HAC01204.1 hypothetical protein [Brevundimonas sp.]MCO8018526.1 hypothetical protein [Brevundimonas diminuta]MCO8020623.1 hypothetical protein [Brevundimonas diminuta]HAL08056.1 hypothetical protein [Brevundimonas sp.]